MPRLTGQARLVGRARGRWLTAVLVVVPAVLLLGSLTAYAAGVRVVSVVSTSMAPTLEPGDRIVTTPVDGADVRPGDLVVVTPSAAWWAEYERITGLPAAAHMVKRVGAVGGQALECCAADGALVRDGVRLDEPWLAGDPGELNSTTFRVTVPEGRLWLLGDNRATSFDSRAMQAITGDGSVPEAWVTARVLRRVG